MKNINIAFLAFWQSFDIYNNNFVYSLNKLYNVTILEQPYNQKPDLIIYSCFYKSEYEKNYIKSINCKKLYYSGENDFPDFNICDYAITQNRFDFENRHLYGPLWFQEYLNAKRKNEEFIINGIDDKSLLNREFCSFVVSNNFCSTPIRTKIYEELSKYKHIASGGKYLNNIGKAIEDKKEFLSKYKFHIASENSFTNGYITEKIIDAFNAKTIPIYAGPKDVIKEFNSKAFINLNDFASFDDLREYIKNIDTNNELYLNILKEPKFNSGILEKMEKDFNDFLVSIIEDKRKFNHKYGRVGLLNKINEQN